MSNRCPDCRWRKPCATHRFRPVSRKPRKRLRSISARRDPAAEVAYLETVLSIRARTNGRCENPFCPVGGWRNCGPTEPHHLRKRVRFGRKTRAERDAVGNLMILGRPCHDWTDAPFGGPRGRLVIRHLGNEVFECSIVRVTARPWRRSAAPLVPDRVSVYTRPREAA